MKFDIDRFREILDTLSRNKSRSFLTGFGVFWGVFMLVALLGGGQGLKEKLQGNFEGFATNSAIIWAQPTTKPYAGFRKDRMWSMVYGDVERLKLQVPELATVSPVLSHWGGSAADVLRALHQRHGYKSEPQGLCYRQEGLQGAVPFRRRSVRKAYLCGQDLLRCGRC